MTARRCDITFTLFVLEKEIIVATYSGEYRSVMELIYDKLFLEDFGECKGIGRCGTCMVRFLPKDKTFTELERNEQATLTKMEIKDPFVRLSCQIAVDEKLMDSLVIIC